MKRFIIGICILISAFLIYHYKSVKYGLEQGYGQLKVLTSAIPLDEYLLTNPTDSVLQKINLIQAVKSFAEDSLGLKETNSYTTVYDQKGKAILWMVTACPEFELKPYLWTFPIAGTFEYKGFFDLTKAKEEKAKLEAEGYETELDEVSAWSTLGWFSDPILTSMLEKDSGRLANLIIHELCHASIYLKDSVALNENLASFIGKKGAEVFLHSIGDTLSIEKMNRHKINREEIGLLIHKSSKRLDSLYDSFDEKMTIEEKRKLKKKLIDSIRWEVAEVTSKNNLSTIQDRFASFKPNNAFFTSYLTYRSKSYYFENELEDKFNGNLKDFIEYYRQEYGM